MSTASLPSTTYDAATEQRHLQLRSDFLIDPDVVFLNHGSFGACPRPVFEAYQRWQLELERQPVEFLGRRLRDLLAEARARLAEYLGADHDEIVYFPNVTAALNAVARSLPLESGDEILTTGHEYGALERTWTFVSEQRGTQIVTRSPALPLDDPAEAVEAIWSGVTPKTRVLFLSHITSPTAVILPIEPLIKRARDRGIWTVVDGAHAVGQIPLNLHEIGVDFYGGNCHKWLSAPKGAGFLYARQDLQHLLDPLVISWGWRPRDPGPSPFVDMHERQGTRDPAAYLTVPTAIDYQAEHDWPRVRAECHELARFARASILRLSNEQPLTTDNQRWFAQMTAVPLPPDCDTDDLKVRLYDEYRIEVPTMRWQKPGIRVSVQGYNTRRDIERLLEALAAILPRRDDT
jgi:isopenicillin-N epimerase